MICYNYEKWQKIYFDLSRQVCDNQSTFLKSDISMDDKICTEITSEGPVTVVAFKTASITNTEAIASASEQIDEFIIGKQPARIVVDFEAVKFFSSQVLYCGISQRENRPVSRGQRVYPWNDYLFRACLWRIVSVPGAGDTDRSGVRSPFCAAET